MPQTTGDYLRQKYSDIRESMPKTPRMLGRSLGRALPTIAGNLGRGAAGGIMGMTGRAVLNAIRRKKRLPFNPTRGTLPKRETSTPYLQQKPKPRVWGV